MTEWCEEEMLEGRAALYGALDYLENAIPENIYEIYREEIDVMRYEMEALIQEMWNASKKEQSEANG